uniref:Nucleotide-diphospho-sugar transferase domain-containing protein n=2 Tax=Craspedostauros australis TaxID=1486917 RepID=A0A7R9ZQD4_9STRA
MAKVICVQLVSALHYNLLFQDVDIVWYKHPLEYFQSPDKMGDSDFDVFFQDDGGHSTRYAPYSANSGFYYVKHNDRTQYFLTSLLLAGDLILKTDSHQQALIALLSEHVSLYGLKVKIMSRDTPEFPGGYHYHQASKRYMKSFFAKEVDPYIFHMSWTKNKDNKLLFFQQMGDWYVNEQCVHQKVDDVAIDDGGTFVSTCCSAEALIECHYRDKPSIVQCKSSPPIDKGHGSWW